AAPPGRVDLQMPAVMLPDGAKVIAYRCPTADGEDFMPFERSVLAGPGELRAQGLANSDGGGIDNVPILDPTKGPRQIDLLCPSIGQSSVGSGRHEVFEGFIEPPRESGACDLGDLKLQIRPQHVRLVGPAWGPGR